MFVKIYIFDYLYILFCVFSGLSVFSVMFYIIGRERNYNKMYQKLYVGARVAPNTKSKRGRGVCEKIKPVTKSKFVR